jgi:AcrR family transcriptional regulator
VLAAAIEVADGSGIEALSMRRLGQELGVEAMSLYNHVANKDDLYVGMLDIVVGQMELPSDNLDWKIAMRRCAISAHEVLVRHPWACKLLVGGTSRPAPSRLRHVDGILRCLREGGFSVELTHHAYHALDSHIVGFTLWQLSFPFETQEELRGMATDVLRELRADDYPHFVEHVVHHMTEPPDDVPTEFDFGLDLILDGLERARLAQGPAAAEA